MLKPCSLPFYIKNEPYNVDNALKIGTEGDPGQLRSAGIGMRLEDGVYLNPFFASWSDPPTYLEIYSAEPFVFGFNNSGPEDHEVPVNFSATVVPTMEWGWEYHGDGIVANGTLHTKTTEDDEGYYTITSISGERNGVKIVQLTEIGVPIPGNEDYAVDNALRKPTDDKRGQLRSAGIGLRLEDGTYLNPFYASWREPPTYLEVYSAFPFVFGFNNSGSEDHELPVTFSAWVLDDSPPPDTPSDAPLETPSESPDSDSDSEDSSESSSSAVRCTILERVSSAVILFAVSCLC